MFRSVYQISRCCNKISGSSVLSTADKVLHSTLRNHKCSLYQTNSQFYSTKYYDDDEEDNFTPGRLSKPVVQQEQNISDTDHVPTKTYEKIRTPVTQRNGLQFNDINEEEPFRRNNRFNDYSSNRRRRDYMSNQFDDDDDFFSNRRKRDFSSNRREDNFSRNYRPLRDRTDRQSQYSFYESDVIDLDESTLTPIKRIDYIPTEVNQNRTDEEINQYREKHSLTLLGGQFPKPILSFDDYEFNPKVLKGFERDEITEPTPIQAQTWPAVLSNKDFIGISQTGSGKTLAYLLPAFEHIKHQAQSRRDGPTVLVLAPTRELVMQILQVASSYGRHLGIRSCAAFGGASRNVQLEHIERGCQILIATPGRLNDFLSSGDLVLRQMSFLVIDEADRMLDMGFMPQLTQIVKHSRSDRQTVMFSATWPEEVQNLARKFLKSPLQMNVGSLDLQANPDITQHFHIVRAKRDMEKKLGEILEELSEIENCKVLIFAHTKRECDRLEMKVRRSFREFRVSAIHGDKTQRNRSNILEAFRNGKINILVATEVAARGIDVSDITHVINFGFPNDCEQYVHRIGRTGRKGKKGDSHTIMFEINRRHCQTLIKLLKDCEQEVPKDLKYFSGRF